MRVRTLPALCCVVAVLSTGIVGCVKKGEENKSAAAANSSAASASAPSGTVKVEPEKPVAQIQTEAQTMNVEQLKAAASQYQQAIADKRVELEKLMAKIKDIPIAEALGKEAQTLKTDVQTLQSSVKALTDRFQVYYGKLKEKGVDLSGFGL